MTTSFLRCCWLGVGGSILCLIGWAPGPPGAKDATFSPVLSKKASCFHPHLGLREKLWIWIMDLGKLRARGAVTSPRSLCRSYRAGFSGTALMRRSLGWRWKGRILLTRPLVQSGVNSPSQNPLSSPPEIGGSYNFCTGLQGVMGVILLRSKLSRDRRKLLMKNVHLSR